MENWYRDDSNGIRIGKDETSLRVILGAWKKNVCGYAAKPYRSVAGDPACPRNRSATCTGNASRNGRNDTR